VTNKYLQRTTKNIGLQYALNFTKNNFVLNRHKITIGSGVLILWGVEFLASP